MIRLMIKKIPAIILILLFLQGCGYTPMYSKNQKINFYIQSIEFNDNDKDLASFIKSNLNNYFTKNTGTNFTINTLIKYEKTAVSKTAEAVVEEYNLKTSVSFQVKSKNIDKMINVSETSNMKNFSDEFEEREYELMIKQSMARSITSRLLIQLASLNAN